MGLSDSIFFCICLVFLSCKTNTPSSAPQQAKETSHIESKERMNLTPSPIKKGNIRLSGAFLKNHLPNEIDTQLADTLQVQTWTFTVERVIGRGSTYAGVVPTKDDIIHLILQPIHFNSMDIIPEKEIIIDAFQFSDPNNTPPTFLFSKQISTSNN